MSPSAPSAPKNRRYWDGIADEYQSLHGRRLSPARPAWGVWRIPESRLQVLGDPRGRDLLELGCGAAQLSIAMAHAGGRPVGLDNSGHQLDHARRLVRRAGVRVPLVHASAEDVPFADAAFDVVFCDHGAMSFADPRRTVPESARLLRPGGILAFCHESPFSHVCTNEGRGTQMAALRRDYFGTGRHDSAAHVEYHPGYGEWIALFRDSGLAIEALIELRPAANATTSYKGWSREWARRWPAENLWKVRKEKR